MASLEPLHTYEYPTPAGGRFLVRALNSYIPDKTAIRGYILSSRVQKAAWYPLRWGLSRGWVSLHSGRPVPPPPEPIFASITEPQAAQTESIAGTVTSQQSAGVTEPQSPQTESIAGDVSPPIP